MLRKEYRLPASIRLPHPTIIRNTFFSAKFSHNELGNNRYGFIVGKRIDKRATHRNFMKRHMRNVAWENNLVFPQGLDILFSVTRLLEKELFLDRFKEFCKSIQEKLR